MFKKITTLLLLFTMFIAFGQEEAGTDTLYLKKGKIVVGRLLSDRNDDFLKISVNGKMEIYSSVDVKKIGSASVQNANNDFVWGTKVGLSFSSVTGKNAQNLNSNPGIAGGVFSTYKFNQLFSLQSELLYVPKGFKKSVDAYSFELNFAAIEIPVLFKMTLPTRQNIGTSLYAGSVVSFITESKVDESAWGSKISNDIGGAVNKQQFGAVVGADLGFKVDGYNIVCDVRYQHSFTQIFKKVPVQIWEGEDIPDLLNSNFSVMFGFMF